jgi:hypothetical protein
MIFIAFDTLLHVKIPYAVVSSFFLTAILMFWTIRLAFRRGESRADIRPGSNATEYPGERPSDINGTHMNPMAMVIAPIDGFGTQRRSATARNAASRVTLRGVILFNSSPSVNSRKEAI